MGTAPETKKEKGKGGNLDTTRNPFGRQPRRTGGAPELLACAGLASALDALLRGGCAVLLGQTRDGGALKLTIFDGDDRHVTYCSSEEELDDAVEAIRNMYVD